MVRSENEARILYTVEKGFILQSKGAHFAAALSAAKLHSAALCAAQHGLYTSNLLPTPMYMVEFCGHINCMPVSSLHTVHQNPHLRLPLPFCQSFDFKTKHGSHPEQICDLMHAKL